MEKLKLRCICHWCGWSGSTDELSKLLTDAVDDEGNLIDYAQCPSCGSIMEIEVIE